MHIDLIKICDSGVFEVSKHEYAIGDDPWCSWCSRRHLDASSAGVKVNIYIDLIKIFDRGVFEVSKYK